MGMVGGLARCLALSVSQSAANDQGAVGNHFKGFSFALQGYDIFFISCADFFVWRVEFGGWLDLESLFP